MAIHKINYIHQSKLLKRFFSIGYIFLLFIVFNSCKKHAKSNTPTLTIFAAASLSDVLSEIAYLFEQQHAVKVRFNNASSGTLARQIEQGATPNLYISANQQWVDYLSEKNLIKKNTQTIIAKNTLALIAPKHSTLKINTLDSLLNLPALLGKNRLAVGDPKHVPVGLYAREVLEFYNWFDSVQLLTAKDARSALMMVEMQEAPLGIVYQTDALKSNQVKVLQLFSEHTHQPIIYTAGMYQNSSIANDFLQYLNSPETFSIWEKYGFKKYILKQ